MKLGARSINAELGIYSSFISIYFVRKFLSFCTLVIHFVYCSDYSGSSTSRRLNTVLSYVLSIIFQAAILPTIFYEWFRFHYFLYEYIFDYPKLDNIQIHNSCPSPDPTATSISPQSWTLLHLTHFSPPSPDDCSTKSIPADSKPFNRLHLPLSSTPEHNFRTPDFSPEYKTSLLLSISY